MAAAATALRTVAIITRLSAPYGSFGGLVSLCPAGCSAAEEQAVLSLAWAWSRGGVDVPALAATRDPAAVGRDSLWRAAAHWRGAHDAVRRDLRRLIGMWWLLDDDGGAGGERVGAETVEAEGGGRDDKGKSRERREGDAWDGQDGGDGLIELLRTPPLGDGQAAATVTRRDSHHRGYVRAQVGEGSAAELGKISEGRWLANAGGRVRIVDATLTRAPGTSPVRSPRYEGEN